MPPDLSQIASRDLALQALKLLAQPGARSTTSQVMLTGIAEELGQRGGNVIDRINRIQRGEKAPPEPPSPRQGYYPKG